MGKLRHTHRISVWSFAESSWRSEKRHLRELLLLEERPSEPGAGIVRVGRGPGEAGVWEACNCPLGIGSACRLKKRQDRSREKIPTSLDPRQSRTHTGDTRETSPPERGDRYAGSRETDTQTPSERPRLGPQKEAETTFPVPPAQGPAAWTFPPPCPPPGVLPTRRPYSGPVSPCPALLPRTFPTEPLNKLAARNSSGPWAHAK